ncbi:hypothetical protein SCUCBS95973_009313 [Sporothrix curviconia]|uniref:HTH araC/xylS-type domain-containing protein n=1 Tax=Sporothrix curviconia TaxID=1260050 RepID=A0ABP0CTV9_9PEZI
MYTTDDDKWRAITSRDPAADGVFVYAVRTTRIYCRPNCKARLARRANVRFYADCRAAEAGGFRACKRCKPLTQGGMPEDEAVARIRELVARAEAGGGVDGGTRLSTGVHGAKRDSPSLLASQARVSRWHFHRKFKEVTGLTPREYLKQRERQQKEKEAATAATATATEAEAETVVPSQSSWPTTTTTPSTSTDSDLFDSFDDFDNFALGEEALFPDLSLLLAETQGSAPFAHAPVAPVALVAPVAPDQPLPTFNDCLPADPNGFHLEGLGPVFLDPALWIGAGEFFGSEVVATTAGTAMAIPTTTATDSLF